MNCRSYPSVVEPKFKSSLPTEDLIMNQTHELNRIRRRIRSVPILVFVCIVGGFGYLIERMLDIRGMMFDTVHAQTSISPTPAPTSQTNSLRRANSDPRTPIYAVPPYPHPQTPQQPGWNGYQSGLRVNSISDQEQSANNELGKLIQQFRSSSESERGPLQGKIKNKVEELFDMRHKLQADLLDRLTAELQAAREIHAKRQDRKAEIIDRKVSELLRLPDPLAWEAPPFNEHVPYLPNNLSPSPYMPVPVNVPVPAIFPAPVSSFERTNPDDQSPRQSMTPRTAKGPTGTRSLSGSQISNAPNPPAAPSNNRQSGQAKLIELGHQLLHELANLQVRMQVGPDKSSENPFEGDSLSESKISASRARANWMLAVEEEKSALEQAKSELQYRLRKSEQLKAQIAAFDKQVETTNEKANPFNQRPETQRLSVQLEANEQSTDVAQREIDRIAKSVAWAEDFHRDSIQPLLLKTLDAAPKEEPKPKRY